MRIVIVVWIVVWRMKDENRNCSLNCSLKDEDQTTIRLIWNHRDRTKRHFTIAKLTTVLPSFYISRILCRYSWRSQAFWSFDSPPGVIRSISGEISTINNYGTWGSRFHAPRPFQMRQNWTYREYKLLGHNLARTWVFQLNLKWRIRNIYSELRIKIAEKWRNRFTV